MKCIVRGCDSDELVYSGTDAFMLGVPTEKVCYDHANSYAQVSALTQVVHITDNGNLYLGDKL
jgi:hypothetical protein